MFDQFGRAFMGAAASAANVVPLCSYRGWRLSRPPDGAATGTGPGYSGSRLARQYHPDLGLLDVMLPDISLGGAGADGYFIKPFSRLLSTRKVEAILGTPGP